MDFTLRFLKWPGYNQGLPGNRPSDIWTPPGVQAVLDLRGEALNDEWDRFVDAYSIPYQTLILHE